MDSTVRHFVPETGSASCLIEDDGRVAYAYLLWDGRIVTDVWLWNSVPAQSQPEWLAGGVPPFVNPIEYITPEAETARPTAESVTIRWRAPMDEHRVTADVYIADVLHARLTPGQKPGMCRFAAKTGPLAALLDVFR